MNNRNLLGILLIVGIFLFACQLGQPETELNISTSIAQSTQLNPPEITVSAENLIPSTTVTPENLISPALNIPPENSFDIRQWHSLQIPRTQHTATLLQNGKVLLIGGSLEPDDFVADEELFDPVTGLSSWGAPLHTVRHGHTATLLPDGRVLVVGGYSLPQQWLSDAEVYDPITDTWTVIPPLYPHGTAHTATLLKDGRVLVIAGCIGSGVCTERVEIFDTKTDSWAEAATLGSTRFGHTAQILKDGRVLVIGGSADNGEAPIDGDALLYDPQTNAWTPTSPMISMRKWAASVQLPDGTVLVAGGMAQADVAFEKITNSAEIFDPIANTWKPAASLAQPRYAYILVTLADGQVLAIGGARDWECCWQENSFVHEIEAYDPITNQWRIIGGLSQPGAYATGILLSNGRLWVAGGQYGQSGKTFPPETWLIVH